MNSDFDKEIDSLLRAGARRDAATGLEAGRMEEWRLPAEQAGTTAAATVEHLDADELNAYTAQDLPAATRLRYQAHLAECTACRRSVTSLVLAQNSLTNKATVPEKAEAALPLSASSVSSLSRGWRAALARLFTVPALRYAVPVLALLIVSLVALIALRRPQENAPLIAQRRSEPVEKKLAPPRQVQEAQPQDLAHAPFNASEKRASDLTEPPVTTKANKTTVADTDATTTQQAEPPVRSAAPPSANNSATSSTVTQATEPPAPSPERRPNVASVPTGTVNMAASGNARVADDETVRVETRDDSRASKQTSKAAEVAEQAAPPEKASPSSDRASAAGAGTASLPSRAARPPVPAARSARQRAVTTPARTEVREVSGRHFRRQNGIWVDSAYQASTATTNVRRGSEQYRALVADEPTIRRIAEQLEGEVIVVWKDRAYRIQ